MQNHDGLIASSEVEPTKSTGTDRATKPPLSLSHFIHCAITVKKYCASLCFYIVSVVTVIAIISQIDSLLPAKARAGITASSLVSRCLKP